MAFRKQFRYEEPVMMGMMTIMNEALAAAEGSTDAAQNDLLQDVDRRIESAGLALPELTIAKLDIPRLRIAQVLPVLYGTYAELYNREAVGVQSETMECARSIVGHGTLLVEIFDAQQDETGVIYAPVMLMSARQSFGVSTLALQRNRASQAIAAEAFLDTELQIMTAHGIALGALADVAERMAPDILDRK